MNRNLIAVLFVLVLLVACAQTPTVVPFQTLTPTTATKLTVTASLVPSSMPSSTATPTSLPTSTVAPILLSSPIPTIVLSPSPNLPTTTPKPTERPFEIVWQSPRDLLVNTDSQWTTRAWSDKKEIGATITLENDPANGTLLRYEKTVDGSDLVRAQVSKNGDPLSMPFELVFELFIDSSFRFEGTGSKWLNIGSFFAPGTKPGGIDDIPYWAVNIDENYRPYFVVKNPDGIADKEKQTSRSITVKKNEWISIRVLVDSGMITTYINESVLYVAKSDRLLRGFHVGDLYGESIAKGSVIKHGDILLKKLK